MILVTGATGNLGKAVIQNLLKKVPAKQIAALARDENKGGDLKEKGVDIRLGDYNDMASLVKAMQGVDKLLFVSSNDVLIRLSQHKNVVDAAKKANIGHILYTSAAMKNIDTSPLKSAMDAHFKTEGFIKESGLNFTMLRNTLYADNIRMFIGEKAVDKGIFFPAGNGKVAYATRADLAEATAVILTSTGHENKAYLLTGPKGYSFNDIATDLSALAGKTVAYTDADPAAFIDTLKKLGLPEQTVNFISAFGAAIKSNDFDIVDPKLENLLGRKPTRLRTYLKEAYFK
jgi:NAD(P)H dehydrogenase (quinone)